MHFTRINFLPVHSNEKIYQSLQNGRKLISNLTPSGDGPPQPDLKRQKLLECVLTGNSKLYLGKVYTEDQINKLSDEEVDKLFNNYEAKLSGQMVKSLGKSIINMYSMGACAALGMSDQDALSEDLENDPFLNSALQRFICELYYRFGSFLTPLSVRLITRRHFYLNAIKMEEQKTNATPSKCEVIGSFIGMDMVGFCSGIGATSGVKIVNILEYCIEEHISSK